jgi:hypothetical protein
MNSAILGNADGSEVFGECESGYNSPLHRMHRSPRTQGVTCCSVERQGVQPVVVNEGSFEYC